MKTQLGVGESGGSTDLELDRTVAAADQSSLSDSHEASHEPANEPSRGDSIGRFVVLGVLGRGGMGVVYSAYDPQLDRKVAIKLLTQAMHSAADAKVRLLREAQAMAKINHPNVIKVHEVGTYNDQIYLAMEFANGGTLRDWLEKAHSSDEILDVFLLAGRGLVAAHEVGLVHRDFKPDNVLLSNAGGVQVTDFGLVSVIDALPRATSVPPPELELTNDTPLSQDLTRTGSIMGTPTYMAPEQFSGQASTAKTDQFSFCVALYEALYKERPFAGANYMELSTNVLTGAVRPVPAGAKVPNAIRRAIVRGLATEPAGRHASMAELLVLLTRDPERRGRRLAWAAAAAVLAIAVAGMVLTRHRGAECSTGEDRIAAVWNSAIRDRISSAFIASSRLNAKPTFERFVPIVETWSADWKRGFVDSCRANHRGEQSAHLLDLRMQCLERSLEQTSSTLDALGRGGTDAVDHALPAVLGLPPLAACADTIALTSEVAPPEPGIMQANVVATRARINVADAQQKLGHFRVALVTAQQALVQARASNYPPVVAEALLEVGVLQGELGDTLTSAATFGEASRLALVAGDSTTAIDAAASRMSALTMASRYEAAQEISDLVDAIAKRARPRVEIAVKLGNRVAFLLQKRAKAKEAEARLLQMLELASRTFGADSTQLIQTLHLLGNLYKEEGRYDDARKALERVVEMRRKVVGVDHPLFADALSDLGVVYRVEGKLDRAKEIYDHALAIRLAALGPDHPIIGTSYNNLGNLYSDQGDHVSAQAAFEKSLAVLEKAYGEDGIELVDGLTNLGNVLNTRGDHEGARKLYDRARALIEAKVGPDDPMLAGVLNNLGVVDVAEHRDAEALPLYERANAIITKAYGPEHPDVVDATINMLSIYKSLGRLKQADDLTQRTIVLVTKVYGAEDPRMGGVLVNFSALQLEEKKYAAALESGRKALTIFQAKLGPDHPYVAYANLSISAALTELHRDREAVPFAERALAIRAAVSASPGDMADAHFALGQALSSMPKARSRALAEIQQALADYTAAEDPANVNEVQIWLRKHR